MILLLLTLALLAPYALLAVAGRRIPAADFSPQNRAKAGVSLVFLITASGHFLQTAAMVEMLPPQVPFRTQIIYITGVFELLGAVGIWIPRVAKLTGLCLILMLIGVLPANVYAAFNHVPFGGHDHGPVYLLVRIPFQFLLIGWIYWATDQSWVGFLLRRGSHRPTRKGLA